MQSQQRRLWSETYSLILFTLIICFPSTASSEECTFVIRTKTGNVNDAGTNDDIYFAIHFFEKIAVPAKNGKKSVRKKSIPRRVEMILDNPGDDRKTGAVDEYRITADCDPSGITAVEIGTKSGDDAWLPAGLEYFVEHNGRKSTKQSVPAGVWISAAMNDGPRKRRAKQFYVATAAAPVFPRSK